MAEIKQALVRRKQVEIETGLPRSSIYAKMRAGTFPQNVRIGARSVAWRRADIDAWIADPASFRAEV
ncbi:MULTISPECIES: helix-turn-helix transcriptional regulator [Burkholderia]|uniref:AlpA family phage regulatory protein n=1 Tax=Burkholderia ambifaria TaxID=152480 RepID=A0AA41ED71_9BURK|nr:MULTISPECIES: AlpA family phage regulatory protein [Burkholderia]KVX93098.1 AlpA family transcriptional regulator [Burkholderia ubonensis]MBR8132707.1 AlpA family phage regulatory protein [Burkholderia ambifaria]PRE00612.1 AlpA family phage regulatory protein [Burkholderia ambifaria]QVN10288.1 AlpA family phage regulatory protein [Burkholderia sp. LAS2]